MSAVKDRLVTELTGVGQAMADKLALLDVYTIEDVLNTFPSRYDHEQVTPLATLVHEQKATIEGVILSEAVVTYYGKKKSRLTVAIQVDTVVVKGVMFNRPFAKKHLVVGDTVTFTGKWDQHRQQLTIERYRVGDQNDTQAIQPVYLLKQVVKTSQFKKIVQQAIDDYIGDIEEILPLQFLKGYKLLDRATAIKQIHFPDHFNYLKQAKRRLIYEEILLFQLKMQAFRKYNRERTQGNAHCFKEEKVAAFIKQLPFQLTEAQQKAWQEIQYDLRSPYRMHRLLQGDVGSGKTAVAAVAMYATINANKQAALMVPTEILAEQHVQSLQALFHDYGRIELLTGSIKGKKREQLLSDLQQGEIDIIIGTHALIQNDVDFHNLGLVIVDEQHRFGVNQRKTLREKGFDPDVLFMTATPIPRTLAITSYGDMDVSVINQMPSGRKAIDTFWVKASMLPRILTFIEKEVASGHQAYVITPLIEESDKLDIQNAVDLYQHLEVTLSEQIKIGLLHGRLTNDEKEQVMSRFSQNDIQVLVATTVVEVGVNVPNATVMVIYDAERFGLSQLHQLRGRVGRGDAQSYCILIADPQGETGKERMRIMTETTNGFELAEHDLKLRGPGDFFGKKQSGLPEFKLADLIHDYRTLETARQDAQTIIFEERLNNDPEYHQLKAYVDQRLQEHIHGFD